LNRVGDDGDDPRGNDPALRFLHMRTLGSAGGAGQSPLRPGPAPREQGLRRAYFSLARIPVMRFFWSSGARFSAFW
jgi:hypothetical protein